MGSLPSRIASKIDSEATPAIDTSAGSEDERSLGAELGNSIHGSGID